LLTQTAPGGILFLPDNNLAIGGQGGGAATGHIFEITNTGASVATVTTPSNGTNFDGSHHLALSSNSPTATLYTLCNGECGANFSQTTLVGGRRQNATTGTNITVVGGAGVTKTDVRGSHITAHGIMGPRPTAAAQELWEQPPSTERRLHQLLPVVPAHGLTFDPKTNDIVFNSGNEVDQFDPTGGTVVSTFTDTNTSDEFDQSAVDGNGHLFVAPNNGNLLGIDYDSPKLICTGASAESFLVVNLDDTPPCRDRERRRPSSRARWCCSPPASSGSACWGRNRV
jgi:hypothetical protein